MAEELGLLLMRESMRALNFLKKLTGDAGAGAAELLLLFEDDLMFAPAIPRMASRGVANLFFRADLGVAIGDGDDLLLLLLLLLLLFPRGLLLIVFLLSVVDEVGAPKNDLFLLSFLLYPSNKNLSSILPTPSSETAMETEDLVLTLLLLLALVLNEDRERAKEFEADFDFDGWRVRVVVKTFVVFD